MVQMGVLGYAGATTEVLTDGEARLRASNVVAQHEFARIGIEVDLAVYPVRNLLPSEVVIQQGERYDQGDLLGPVPFNLIQKFLFVGAIQ